MFEGQRVVVVTPAGRVRYLRLLAAHVLSSPLVDEWHLWQNTREPADLAFMQALAAMHARVRLIPPPLQQPNGNRTIGQFFRTATDSDTVYVRMDDDIVYCEPEFFPRFLTQRVLDREPLMMHPLTINNAVCSFLLKELRLLDIRLPLTPACLDRVGWESHEFAEALHRWFLGKARDRAFDNLRFGNVTTAMARVSINCIAWFGESLQSDGGVFPTNVDEEEYVTVTLPLLRGRVNRITGQAVLAHYAFYPQRAQLDATDLLERYGELAPAVDLPATSLGSALLAPVCTG